MRLFSQVNAGGTSIVLVTHDEAVAQKARRVIRLADGRIISDETRSGSGDEPRADLDAGSAPAQSAGEAAP